MKINKKELINLQIKLCKLCNVIRLEISQIFLFTRKINSRCLRCDPSLVYLLIKVIKNNNIMASWSMVI